MGPLTSTIPPISPPAWVSFMTGMNPGKHGIFGFLTRKPGTYEIDISGFLHDMRWKSSILYKSRYKKHCIWSILNQHNKKVVILNVPLTYPPQKINGFMITGIFTPNVRKSTFPSELYNELINKIGGYRIDIKEGYHRSREDDFLKDLYYIIEKRGKATIYLMQKCDWDFFITVFTCIDRVQHYFWKYMDTCHPHYDPRESEQNRNAILNCYQKVDEIIAKILKRIDERTALIVMSDHGFGPCYKNVNINKWLVDIGLMKLKKKRRLFDCVRESLLKINLTKNMMHDWKIKFGVKIKKIMPQKRKTLRKATIDPSYFDVDWLQTKAYSIDDGGRIYINLKGREPDGIIKHGEEYEELRNYIIKKISKLKDEERGKRIVDKIYKREEVYSGHYLDQAPDLINVLEDQGYKDLVGIGFDQFVKMKESGTHRSKGLFLIKGNNIKIREVIQNANIMDIAPTILHIMGIPIPSYMDGRVLEEVFN